MFADFLSKEVRTSARRPSRRARRCLPQFLPLEHRTLFSTFTVTNLNDSGPGSLRAELAAANSGSDTIVFAHNLHGTITLASELQIADSVTIDGPGANKVTVSGNNASRVFEVDAGFNASISGLTISHGYAPGHGGGILNDGSNLTLSGDELTQNVVFETNSPSDVTAHGGGLSSASGALIITDCQITNNQALGASDPTELGEGLGGGIAYHLGSLTITNSTISGNLAQGGAGSIVGLAAGGGIVTFGDSGMLVLNNSTISDNRAVAGNNTSVGIGEGGGLAAESPVSISQCTFSGNAAVGGNGGVGLQVGQASGAAFAVIGPNAGPDAGAVTVSQSTFDHNQALAGNGGTSSGQADPSVDVSYGALTNAGGSLSVSGSSFSHNTSVGGNNATAVGTDIAEAGVAEGGAINNEFGADTTVSSSSFNDNQAIGGNNDSASGPVVHSGSGFGAGICSAFGFNLNGIPILPNTLSVTSSLFAQNTARGGNNDTGAASVFGLVGTGAGGAIMNYGGGTASVSGSELLGNQAIGGNNDTATGSGPTLAGDGAGGALFNALGNYFSSGVGLFFNDSVLTVSNCLIAGNQAQADDANALGGGVYNGATATLKNSFIAFNEAEATEGSALGGGIYNGATANLSLSSCQVILNQADGSPGIGGGVYTLGTFTYDPTTSILFNHASTSGNNIGP
jgi:hypothetical protein